jgi:ferrochelatase
VTEPPYDAVVVLGFGGPEGPDEVMPFLENVTRGRDVPPERLEEVADQYARFGGVSPINGQNRELVAALQGELDRRGRDLPVVLGNRNWAPYIEDTVAELTDGGHRRLVAFATAAYSSYSACRQYLEDIDRARAASGDHAPVIDKVRPFWNHPGFIAAMTDRVGDAVASVDPQAGRRPRLVFTAHSIPLSMARSCDYEAQLRDAAQLIVSRLGEADGGDDWDLVFQSRSGPPQVPWLEPDVVDHLETLAGDGVTDVVLAPIGFLSDHMEVVFDLDTQARETADRLGLRMLRAGTVGTHPDFVAGAADLIDELLVGAAPRALGPLGPRPRPCAADCCPRPQRPTGPTRPTGRAGPN